MIEQEDKGSKKMKMMITMVTLFISLFAMSMDEDGSFGVAILILALPLLVIMWLI